MSISVNLARKQWGTFRIEWKGDGIMDMVEIAFSLVFSKLIKLNLIIMAAAAAALSSLFMLKIALVANDEWWRQHHVSVLEEAILMFLFHKKSFHMIPSAIIYSKKWNERKMYRLKLFFWMPGVF